MEREQWKDEVLKSLQAIKRAAPNPFLFTRIEERIKSSKRLLTDSVVTVPKLSLAFAGIALLGMLNFFVLKNSDKGNIGSGNSQSAYSLNSVNYQLY